MTDNYDEYGPTRQTCTHEAIIIGGKRRCAKCGEALTDDACVRCGRTWTLDHETICPPPSSAPTQPSFSGAGKKHDQGKPRYDLLPTRGLAEFVQVLTFGAAKYEANGWKKVVGWRWRYARAGLTHVFRWLGGERYDVETNLHHLAHALCCFIFVLDNELSLEAGVPVPDGDAPAPPESQSVDSIESSYAAQEKQK